MGVEHATPAMLILLFAIFAPVLFYIGRARKGDDLFVRRIAGVDAVDEALGRTAELGRERSYKC